MSDYMNKKYFTDDKGNRIEVISMLPVKYNLALDEIKFCVGCVESVVKCAVEVEHNLTDIQMSNTMATLEGLSKTVDLQFEQVQNERVLLKEDTLRFTKLRDEVITFNAKYGKFFKVAYSGLAGVFGIIGYFVGLNL